MAGELRTIPALYHLLAYVRRRVSGPCGAASLRPLQGFLQAATNINIMGYFISSLFLPLPIFTWHTATQASNTVPRTLTLLKLDQKK